VTNGRTTAAACKCFGQAGRGAGAFGSGRKAGDGGQADRQLAVITVVTKTTSFSSPFQITSKNHMETSKSSNMKVVQN
jgi:hypothetical protein